jgi:hypothetical protein
MDHFYLLWRIGVHNASAFFDLSTPDIISVLLVGASLDRVTFSWIRNPGPHSFGINA